jgi:hypothetical protein
MTGQPSGGIFLSYRREDAAPYARLLQFQLRERFPDAQVFIDLDSIEAGLPFAEVIRDAVDSCAVLVALIGRKWATAADEEGRRRLDDPGDYVRFEVQKALERRVRVIPVLVDDATPLRQQQLPPELQQLAGLNAFELSYSRYEFDAGRLLDLIQRVLLAAGPAEPVHQTPPGGAHQMSPVRHSIALYDSSSGGFSLSDFETNLWEPAAGELSLDSSEEARNDILVIARDNTEGTFVAWLCKYGYLNGRTVIPVGDPASAGRRFRVRCQVRAREAEHTLLLTFKMDGAPMRQYLGQRRHRITPDIWTDIDDYFEQSFLANCRLRFEDRSVSAAPSRLEIRNFVVTEYEPPLNLMPVAT